MQNLIIKLDKWIVTISNNGFVVVTRKNNPKDEWFFYSTGDVQVTTSDK